MGGCFSTGKAYHNSNSHYSGQASESARSASSSASASPARLELAPPSPEAELPRLDVASPQTLKKQRDLLFKRIESQGSSFRTDAHERGQFQAAYIARHESDFGGGKQSWDTEVWHLDWIRQQRPELAKVAKEDLVALRAWTTQDYTIVQDVLERDSEPTTEGLAYAKAITSGLHSLPGSYEHRGTVFTGENQGPQWVAEHHAVGEVATSRRFFATAETKEGAWQGKRVDWQTHSLSGKKISAFSYHPDEQEVLFPPGTKFRTDDVDASSEPGKTTIVQSEVR